MLRESTILLRDFDERLYDFNRLHICIASCLRTSRWHSNITCLSDWGSELYVHPTSYTTDAGAQGINRESNFRLPKLTRTYTTSSQKPFCVFGFDYRLQVWRIRIAKYVDDVTTVRIASIKSIIGHFGEQRHCVEFCRKVIILGKCPIKHHK